MKKSSIEKETITDNQEFIDKKKLEKIFRSITPTENQDKGERRFCPVRDIFSMASDKWSVLIIGFLGQHEAIRFNELKKLVYGISSKILSQRLKRLERDGYLERKVYIEVPIRVEYKLTALGFSYLKQLLSLGDWIDEFASDILDNRKKYDKLTNQ